MEPTTALKRTPFHHFHRAAGAKLVEFAGFEMPVRYTGDVREHVAVRTTAGLFDISHMGEFDVRGAGAAEWLDRMVTNHVGSLGVGQALYSPMCRPDAGIVDDLLVYRFADHYMVVVNAANLTKDFAWLAEHKPAGVTLEDRSDATALLAVQGPKAPDVLRGHVPEEVLELGYYRFTTGSLFGVPATLSRTGYTGEDGFELYFDPAHADTVWNGLMTAGKPHGLELIGLGARDTLRLEMGYMLYGNDIDDTTTPLEANLQWLVKMKKGEFVGRPALDAQKTAGIPRKLVGFTTPERTFPRAHYPVFVNGEASGEVRSGTMSPSCGIGIGTAYVPTAHAKPGNTIEIDIRGKRVTGTIVETPFWKNGTHR